MEIYLTYCVIYASDFKKVLIFFKFHPMKKIFLSEKSKYLLHVTIKFKHSDAIPNLCVLYFTETQGTLAPVRYSRFGIQDSI